MDSKAEVYAELLQALDRDLLRAHCDAFVQKQLAHTQQSVDAAAAALQRLCEVMCASQSLRGNKSEERGRVALPLSELCELQHKVASTLKRSASESDTDTDSDAMQQPSKIARTASSQHVRDSDDQSSMHSAVKEELAPKNELVREEEAPPEVADPATERLDDSAPALASHEDTKPLDGDSDSKMCVVETKQPIDAPSALPHDDASLTLTMESKRATIDNALNQLIATAPGSDVLAHVHEAVAIPSDFESSCPDVQATVVRTLLDRVEALWNDPMYAGGTSTLSVKRRRAVAAVVAAALDFVVAFVVQPASRPLVDAPELLSILDRIGAAWTSFRDGKQMLGRLRAIQRDLTAFVEQTHASAFHEWELHQRLTKNKLQQFDNMRATLESWLEGGRCRGSALDRLMEEFERLLTRSLLVWDVARENVVHTCVAHMTHIATDVDGSIEKLAARTAKLDAFRNLLSADVPQATLDAREQNKELERTRVLVANASSGSQRTK